jgi:peptidoglycan/xylan/chitin deacetylase (PgdA/CDA1 family)
MIAENTAERSWPTVPVEPWRPNWKIQANNLAMRTLGRVGGMLSRVFGNCSPETFGILTCHRVVPHTPNVPAPTHNVTPSSLRELLTGLTSRGYQFLPLAQALRCHAANASLPTDSIVLTFDDCFESVYTYAWPILCELSIPATLFLSTAYLDSDKPFPFDTWGMEFTDRVPPDHYRPIRSEQCREMAASGLIELGTHTHTHADFRQHVAEFAAEMQVAAEILHTRFGVSPPTFALPIGSPHTGHGSLELINAARQSGAACALTTEVKLVDVRSDPFGWGRINVFSWDTSATLNGKLTGWYDWAPRTKHRLLSARREQVTQ